MGAMNAAQLKRVGAAGQVGGGAQGELLDQLAGYGSMDMLGLGVQVTANERANASNLVTAIISVRNREAQVALKALAE